MKAHELPAESGPATACAPAVLEDVRSITNMAARSLAMLVARHVLTILASLLTTIIVSRRVGPSVWGLFAIAQIAVLSSQDVLGRGGATYLIKKKQVPTSLDIDVAFTLQQAIGIVLMLATIGLAIPTADWFSQPEMMWLLFAAAIAIYGYTWRSIPVALLERDLDYRRVAIVEVLDTGLFASIAILGSLLMEPIFALSIALIARSAIPAISALSIRPHRTRLRWLNQSESEIRIGSTFGSSVALSSLVGIGMLWVPALFVGKQRGMAELGLLQMAFSLYANLLFATAAILRVNFSKYSRLMNHGDELRRALKQDLEILACCMIPVIVLCCGLSPGILPLVLGPKWAGVPLFLLTLAPAYLVLSVFWAVFNPALLAAGKHKEMTIMLLGLLISYVLASWAAVDRLGGVGVCSAFSIAQVLFHVVLLFRFKAVYGDISMTKVFSEISIGCVFLVLIWVAAEERLQLAIALSVVYAAVWCVRNLSKLYSFRAGIFGGADVAL